MQYCNEFFSNLLQYADPTRQWAPGGPSPAASPGPIGHPHPPPSPQQQHGPPQSPGHAPSPSPQPPQPAQSPHQVIYFNFILLFDKQIVVELIVTQQSAGFFFLLCYVLKKKIEKNRVKEMRPEKKNYNSFILDKFYSNQFQNINHFCEVGGKIS